MKIDLFLKKTGIIGLSLIIFISLSAFSEGNMVTERHNQNWTPWSHWIYSDCFVGISYRYRERKTSLDDKNQVQVEIKNGYNHGISLSHRVTTDPNALCIYRFELKPREVHTTEEYVLKNKKMYVKMDEVRFAGDQYGDPFRKCDRY